MTKKLLILVISLLGCILLYTFSALSHSPTNNRTPWSLFHLKETQSTTYALTSSQNRPDTSSQNLADANADGLRTVEDVIYMINFLFKGSNKPPGYPNYKPDADPPPDPLEVLLHGDAGNDCKITISDVIYMINYMFKGGPAPEYHPPGGYDPPPTYQEQCCCCVYGHDPTKCDISRCSASKCP